MNNGIEIKLKFDNQRITSIQKKDMIYPTLMSNEYKSPNIILY